MRGGRVPPPGSIRRSTSGNCGESSTAGLTLLTTPSRSLESVQAVLDLAVRRFRSQTVSDPHDVFYDYGDARVLFFLERAADDLRAMLESERRAAG